MKCRNDKQTEKFRGLISNQSQDSFRTPLLDIEANKGKIKCLSSSTAAYCVHLRAADN